MKKRIFSVLLALCILITFMPTLGLLQTADAATTTTTTTNKSVMLGISALKSPSTDTNGVKVPNSYIYFGDDDIYSSQDPAVKYPPNGVGTPIKWRVLDADKASDGSNGNIFLLAEELPNARIFDTQSKFSVQEWSLTEAGKWCKTFYETCLNQSEQAGVYPVKNTDNDTYEIWCPDDNVPSWRDMWLPEGTTVFLPSVRELQEYVCNTAKIGVGSVKEYPLRAEVITKWLNPNPGETTETKTWSYWTRSISARSGYEEYVGCVGPDNYVIACKRSDKGLYVSCRPAVNLKAGQIAFTMQPITADKDRDADDQLVVSSTLPAVETYNGNDWMVAFWNNDSKFTAKLEMPDETCGLCDEMTVTYSNATPSTKASGKADAKPSYISVMITEKGSDDVLYYGHIAKVPVGAVSGTATLTIPETLSLNKEYDIKLFNEVREVRNSHSTLDNAGNRAMYNRLGYWSAAASPMSTTTIQPSLKHLTANDYVVDVSGFDFTYDNSNHFEAINAAANNPTNNPASTEVGELSTWIEYNGQKTNTVRDAGDYTIHISITGGTKYAKTSDVIVATVTIKKHPLKITGLTAVNRPYNGITTVKLTGGTLEKEYLPVDVVMPTTGTVETADAGKGKAVTIQTPTLINKYAGSDPENFAKQFKNYTVAPITGVTVDIEKLDISGASYTVTPEEKGRHYPYTGSEIKLSVSDMKVGNVSVPESEYTVVGNTQTESKKDLTMKITAKETSTNFCGEISYLWEVGPRWINIFWHNSTDRVYGDGKEVYATTDEYMGNHPASLRTEGGNEANAGTYTAYVYALNWQSIYCEVEPGASCEYTIAPKSITEASVTIDAKTLLYTGKEQSAHIIVKDTALNQTLVEGKDYELVAENDGDKLKATESGIYTVTVKGIGNYTGTKPVSWGISDNSSITFDANGGTGTMEPQTMNEGDTTEIATNTFTRKGYRFVGWNTKADGSGKAYADKESVVCSIDITIYAQWTEDSEAPVVSGITSGESYRGDVSFTVTDEAGIASVSANGKVLTADSDGKYTLTAGSGKVSVIAEDKAGNKTEIIVTVNSSSMSGTGSTSGTTVVKPTIGIGNDIGDVKKENAADGSSLIKAEQGTTKLSKDGTTATITPAEGYEIDSVTVNGEDKGAVDTLTGLKNGDKVVVTFKAKEKDGNSDSADADNAYIRTKIAKIQLIARSTKTVKKNIKVTLKTDKESENIIKNIQSLGYIVKYKFYRSTKKSLKYVGKITKTTKNFTNTKGVKDTRYYYKARLQVYDANGKLIAQTALKQCKYATHLWTK